MAEFSPQDFVEIRAALHGDGFKYRVAIGSESWDPSNPKKRIRGAKIQIGGPTKTQAFQYRGRQAPTFPITERHGGGLDCPELWDNLYAMLALLARNGVVIPEPLHPALDEGRHRFGKV